MNKFYLMILMMVATSRLSAETGTLCLTVQDETGAAVSNLTVVVSTINRLGFNAGKSESDFTEYRATTDSDGKAQVAFDCIDGDFQWWIDSDDYYTPGISEDRLGVERLDPCAEDKVEISVEKHKGDNGQAVDWLKIFRLAEPFKVTERSLTNTVTVLKKRRPRHLDCDRNGCHVLPFLSTSANESGFISNSVDRVAFDLSSQRLVRNSRDYEWGAIADLWISRKCTGVPDDLCFEGRIDFPEGCGVYKATKTSASMGPICWEVDTNEVFASSIEYSYRKIGGVVTNVVPIASADEYLVLRTRVKEVGASVKEWNYALIAGPIYGWREFAYDVLLFNPTPGDTSLEHVE